MREYDKELKKFKLSELENLNFGKLEGEKDDKLSDSFFFTNSILNLLKGKYNYILSPKGGGKSAFFRILNDKLHIPKRYFDYSKYSIIGINEAFGLDSDYLNGEKFTEEENRKNYTISWAIYLLSELLKDVTSNHKEKQGYNEIINSIKNIDDFKDRFKLYNILDFLDHIKFGLSFMVGGQPIDVSPKFKIEAKKEKLVLNTIFKQINDFYKTNNLTALILIDRLDNFVRKEAYHIQKNYIQGLIDCIEEINHLENIAPVLFIRTDLFYAFDIDFEFDKVKERTQDLVWEEGETLNFIVYRLLSNNYIRENYLDYFHFIIDEGIVGGHRHHFLASNSFWEKLKFWKKKDKKRIDLKRTLNYTIAEKFIRLIFPKTVELYQNKDLCDWIVDYLEDANKFVNPRVIIYFFNELIKAQVVCNRNIKLNNNSELEATNHTDHLHFNIFSPEVFPEVYKKVQNDELRNIYKILKTKDYQTLFKEVNERTKDKSFFNYGDFNIKRLNISKEEYERLLKYLCLLGYCKEGDKQTYEVPKLYQYKMELMNID